MSIDIEGLGKRLEADLANPNGYWNTIKKKRELTESRLPKVEQYVLKHGMDAVIKRIMSEHDEAYVDKCYKSGCMPYPNNKLEMLWKWVENTYEPVRNDLIPEDFLTASYFVKGYWFCVFDGQGTFYRIYDGKLNQIFQI